MWHLMIALRFAELSVEFGARGTSCAHERVCLCATAVCGKVAGSVRGLWEPTTIMTRCVCRWVCIDCSVLKGTSCLCACTRVCVRGHCYTQKNLNSESAVELQRAGLCQGSSRSSQPLPFIGDFFTLSVALFIFPFPSGTQSIFAISLSFSFCLPPLCLSLAHVIAL